MTTRPRRCRVASTMTLRSLHGTGGLFDTGVTGKAGFLSATLNTPDVLKTIDASQLFSGPSAEDAIEISLDGTGLEHLGNDVPLVELAATLVEPDDACGSKDFSASGNESEFFEGFVDLSSYLAEGDSLPVVMNVSSADIKLEQVEHAIKRAASVAFPSTPPPPTPNTDHDYYTSKPKKARFSFSESDADSTMETETTSNGTHKYQERRRKNNIASRRSRETRKQKFVGMEVKAVELEMANAKLEGQVTELENLTKLMKGILVQKLSNKM